MPAAPLLTDDEIRERLGAHPAWAVHDRTLVRTFHLEDFRAAVGFVDKLIAPSDGMNHHPDVAIHWNEVTLSLWTHASGGITERDFALARAIDEVAG